MEEFEQKNYDLISKIQNGTSDISAQAMLDMLDLDESMIATKVASYQKSNNYRFLQSNDDMLQEGRLAVISTAYSYDMTHSSKGLAHYLQIEIGKNIQHVINIMRGAKLC